MQLVDQKKRQNIKNRRVAEATGLTLPSKAYYIWFTLLIDGFIKNQKVLEETMCAEYKVSSVEVQKISNKFKTEVVAEKDQAQVV